jgi:sigma-B regulation protein RsbU (phosphoserine phosphatase)
MCALLVLFTAAALTWFAHKDTIASLRSTQRRSLDNVLFLLVRELDVAHQQALRVKLEAVEAAKNSLEQAVSSAEAMLEAGADLEVWKHHSPNIAVKINIFVWPWSSLPPSLLPAATALTPDGQGEFAVADNELTLMIRRGNLLITATRSLDEADRAGVRGMEEAKERFFSLLNEVEIQQSGFAAVLNQAGDIVRGPPQAYVPEKLRATLASGTFAVTPRRIMVLPDQKDPARETLYLLDYFRPLSWTVVLAAPVDEIEAPALQLVAGQLQIALMVLAGGAILGLFFALRVSGPIRKLARLARALPEQDIRAWDAPALVKGLPLVRRDEVGDLARSFRQMATELRATVLELVEATSRQERMNQELRVARDIQYGIVPSVFPHLEGLDMYASMITAKEVGGDLYDLFLLDEDRLCFVMGDVSDKSVPAALFMSVAATLTRAVMRSGPIEPDGALGRINNSLAENNPRNMFVTLCIGVLDRRNGEFLYSSAGHMPPVRVSSTGAVMLPRTGDMVAGAMPDLPYALIRDRLEIGEALFLYTDGISEARSTNRELYGEDRLLKCLAMAELSSAKAINEEVLGNVAKHTAGAVQSDDIAVMTILRLK